jgi:hypothetical protein
MIIKGYTLVNEIKAEEAVRAAGDNEVAILAEYDKRGGLIKKDGVKVENGTFWDFENKVAKTPKKKTNKVGSKGKGKGKKK